MVEQFGLSGVLELDAGDYVDGAQQASDATEDMADSADSASNSLLDIEPAGVAAGGALAGIGTAAQSALDNTRSTREELHRTATALDLTQSEMVDLTNSMTDGTLSQEDAAGALSSLQEQGVETKDELKRLTTASDALADATGASATVVAEDLGPAMAALGDDVTELEEVQDSIAIAVNESTLEMSEMTQIIQRSSDELEALGLDTEETAGVLSAFADETGLSGRELRREFSDAVEEADGDMDALIENTELSEDVLSDWEDQLDESQGITEEYSDSVADNTSTMDDLRARYKDVQLAAADMIGPIDSVAPAMQAAGSAAMVMSTINMTAVVPSLVSVATAAAPILVPLLAITAAIGALAVAWKKDIGGIRDIVKGFKELIESMFGDIKAIINGDMSAAIDLAKKAFLNFSPAGILINHRDKIFDVIKAIPKRFGDEFKSAVKKALSILMWFHPAGVIYKKREELMDVASKIPERLRSVADDAVSFVTNKFDEWSPRERFETKVSNIVDEIQSLPETLKNLGQEAIENFADGIKDAATAPVDAAGDVAGDVADSISSKLPGSDAEEGPLSNITDQAAAIPGVVISALEGAKDDVGRKTSELAQEATVEPEFERADDGYTSRPTATMRAGDTDSSDDFKSRPTETMRAGDTDSSDDFESRPTETMAQRDVEPDIEFEDSTVTMDSAEFGSGSELDSRPDIETMDSLETSSTSPVDERTESDLDFMDSREFAADSGLDSDDELSDFSSFDDSSSSSDDSGGMTPEMIRRALEGMELIITGGTVDVDGDVATMDDLDARFELEGTRGRNRGFKRL